MWQIELEFHLDEEGTPKTNNNEEDIDIQKFISNMVTNPK